MISTRITGLTLVDSLPALKSNRSSNVCSLKVKSPNVTGGSEGSLEVGKTITQDLQWVAATQQCPWDFRRHLGTCADVKLVEGIYVLVLVLLLNASSWLKALVLTWRASNPWGYPQIIHFNRSFHEINHPAIGVPPWLRNHPEVLADLPPCVSKTHPWPRLGWVPGQWTATPWSKGVETPLRCSNDSEVTVKSVKFLRPNSAQLITYHNLS